jgi:hypothetical protein
VSKSCGRGCSSRLRYIPYELWYQCHWKNPDHLEQCQGCLPWWRRELHVPCFHADLQERPLHLFLRFHSDWQEGPLLQRFLPHPRKPQALSNPSTESLKECPDVLSHWTVEGSLFKEASRKPHFRMDRRRKRWKKPRAAARIPRVASQKRYQYHTNKKCWKYYAINTLRFIHLRETRSRQRR